MKKPQDGQIISWVLNVPTFEIFPQFKHINFEYCIVLFPTLSILINIDYSNTNFDIYRQDANELVRKVKADVAFVDPPYNSRQYSRFYHVLENITKWEKPELEGVALKPKAENMSDYCKNSAPAAFADLIANIDAKYIVVTYNNTYNSKSTSSKNKITLEEIESILKKKGSTRIEAKEHPYFNAGKTNLENHKEYVFITEVGVHNEYWEYY